MSLSMSEELAACMVDILDTLFDYVHGAGASATAAQAKTAAKNWMDSNYPQFATQEFADAIVNKLFVIYDANDGWAQFRDKTAAYHPHVKRTWIQEVLRRAVKKSNARMIKDALMEKDGAIPVDDLERWNVYDVNGDCIEQNIRGTLEGDSQQTHIRRSYSNYRIENRKKVMDATDWEVV